MTAWPDPARPGAPLNPEQEGPHWLRYEHDGYVEVSAFLWERDGYWVKSRHVHYSEWLGRWTYLGPCLTPDQATALQARVEELEVETKKAKFIHQYEVKELQARATKLTRLVEILVENDPEDMAADAVTVLDVWRKEACELLARHARLNARQAGMEQMRENESAEIRAALEGKKDE
jgi:hypothetical protein